MARTTRSTTQHQEQELVTPLPPRIKHASKKRKRNSLQDNDEQPATKQLRSDQSISIKDEQDNQELHTVHSLTTPPQLQNAGDVPIDPVEALKILDILEMSDTQGLLDRVFPLHSEASGSPIHSRQDSYSFRTLLKESSQHPLCVLRTAVRHLLPISSHRRSRPSTPAAQQLRFCNLAFSLLDQASFHSVPIPPDLQSILPSTSDQILRSPTSPLPPKRKYALMQRLTTGNWWTSLNSDYTFPQADGRELKDLPTAYAELVAIIPPASNSTSNAANAIPIPTLGSYHSKKPIGLKPKLPMHRRVSCGTFLDYGSWASFAPNFDQDGVEVGRRQLGEVIWGWEERERERMSARREWAEGRGRIVEGDDAIMSKDALEAKEKEREYIAVNVDAELEGLLPPHEVKAIKVALGSLELENAVQELLERNQRALERLEELQVLRLSNEGGGSSQVEEDSEEWDTAQGIIDSLTLLASLRPRPSIDVSDVAPIVPALSILRKLHRTLPLTPSPGWYGTLLQARATALRDDSTLKVRSGASTAIAPTDPATITAPIQMNTIPTTTVPTPTTSAYSGYSYSYSATPQQPTQQQYRPPTTYASYKPGQAPTYYQGAYNPQQAAAQGLNGPQSYYGTQTYGGGATGQQPYAYTNWYNYPPAVAGGTSSGRGTPQPATVVASPATVPTTYGSFFGSATPPPTGGGGQRTPAVANTVVGNKTAYQGVGQQGGSWGTGAYAQAQSQGQQVAPTLPVHLRSTSLQPVPGTPGTPPVAGVVGSQQPSIYETFQQPVTPAAR